MHKTLKIFQKRLTNLTAKNKSLLLLKLLKSQFMDVQQLDFLKNEPAFSVIQQLMAGQKNIVLCNTVDSRDSKNNAASHQLRQLWRTDRFIYEERGAKDLYIGYPFVHGKLLDDTPVRCPLLFFPVSLKEENNLWVLSPRKQAGVSFNKTFLLAVSHYSQIQFEESFLDTDFNDFPTDDQEFRTALYKLISHSALELNFNPATFEDRLVPFQDYSKHIYEQGQQTGRLMLQPEAVLGIFPQAGSDLIPDFESLMANPRIKDIEDFFISASELISQTQVHRTMVSKMSKEEEMMTPYPVDASQEKAIKAVKTGSSVVIQGPPGSGKSQLICNLIADQIARGRNVLLVCQKRAALDVVYQRLEEQGLEDFTALIHDFKNDRKALYQKIDRQIERIDRNQSENNSLDVIYLERNFLKMSRQIDQITESLDELRDALYDTRDCGLSVKELYLTSQRSAPFLQLRREYEHFHFSNHDNFILRLRNYLQYASKLEAADYPWAERRSFSKLGIQDQDTIASYLQEIFPRYQQVVSAIDQIIHIRPTIEECEWILEREDTIKKMLALLENEQVFGFFKICLKHNGTDSLWLANMKTNFTKAFGEDGVEKSLHRRELPYAQEKAREAAKAQSQWLEKAKWRLFSKDRSEINELLTANGLSETIEDLQQLIRMIDNRMNLEHNRSKLGNYEWLTAMPESLAKQDYLHWLDQHLQALEAKKIFIQLRNGVRYLNLEQMDRQEMHDNLYRLLDAAREIPSLKIKWMRYLTPRQINQITEEITPTQRFLETLEADFDLLVEFDQLKDALRPAEIDIIAKLTEEQTDPDPEAVIQLFDNSIRINWIHHLEAKYPVLRSVSTPRLAQWEHELQAAIEEKLNICKQIVLVRARERTYKDLNYNRLNNRTTYRDLQHQTNKKRNIWPIRKLIQNFSHELFDLIPCWMASPESVSAMFPMEESFDLVIFDEASQCFAEKGIPAMYRGKQVVIAGDSQQLAPSDLYQPRWEEDEEGDPALEVLSLLDLGSRYLSQIQLTGHYRSRSLDLIDFSNTHFYGGQLQFTPHIAAFNDQQPAIDYTLVDGVWEKSTNQKEAEMVADLVETLLREGERSIGVITFNFQQQTLIMDLVENRRLNLPPSFFVKNIENVQGDERDIIIFSIGYAPTKNGRMTAKFGTLNVLNGENRLNVAITRARLKIYLISSILPAQLSVEETKNEGPRMLKRYLQYAYDVSAGNYKPSLHEKTVQRPGWYLKNKLLEKSLLSPTLTDELPFADLAIRSAADFQGLVLTDDNRYYTGLSTKSLHAYEPMQLQAKGWRTKRIFSRQWWKDPKGLSEELQRFIGNLEGE